MGTTTNSIKSRWKVYLNDEINFYDRSSTIKRVDGEFPWEWYTKHSKHNTLKFLIKKLGLEKVARSAINSLRPGMADATVDRINKNIDNIWEARSLLKDELSKLLFDRILVLRSVGENKFYFPRNEFAALSQVIEVKDFGSSLLPNDYMGLPLRLFRLFLEQSGSYVNVISTQAQVDLMNDYHQYIFKRNDIHIRPEKDDTVFDCGACIHEISLIFGGLVGLGGGVHCFDPIPLHVRYGKLQAEMNPQLKDVLRFNTLAVGEQTAETANKVADASIISPGGLNSGSFDMTTLDDYVQSQSLNSVDFVKMDIEGYEINALNGATNLVQEFKPKLAISGYHRFEDLWEIPFKIKELNSNYNLFFSHHSPIGWESVFYAAESATMNPN